MPVNIFFCYARADEALLKKLKTHLRPLQRQGLIEIWYDREISPGIERKPEIIRKLNTAQIILLLVSPDFIDSDYCYGVEMKLALERHRNEEVRVIPIILRPVHWHGEPFGELQALPADGRPVTDPEWHDQDRAFYHIVQGISAVVEQLPTSPIVAEAPSRTVASASGLALPVQQEGNDAPLTSAKWGVLQTFGGHTSHISSLALSLDGAILVSGSTDHTIKVWNPATGKEVRTLTGHVDMVADIALSADGATLASGSRDKTIKLWNLTTGKLVQTFTGHTDGVMSVAISADGAILVSGGADHTIKVWDLATGKEERTLAGHTGTVYSVALSADRTTLVSGGVDHTIKVWDLATGKEERTLAGHTGTVWNIVPDLDGTTLVSGSWDHTIKVWNLITSQEMQTLTGHRGVVSSIALSADGTTLVSGSWDHTIKVWGKESE